MPPRFGLQIVPAAIPAADPVAAFRRDVRMALQAVEVGFTSIWVPQHYLAEPLRYLQPVPLLSYLAAIVPEATIGTCIFIMPLSHPVKVAEEIASLDIISDGRFVLGVGSGYNAREAIALDIEPSTLSTRYDESLEVVKRLWSGERFDFHGAHFKLTDVKLSVRPVQTPRPPIWVGARSAHAVSRVIRRGDTWIAPPGFSRLEPLQRAFLASYEEAGRQPPAERPIRIDVVLGETRDRAIEIAQAGLGATFTAFHHWSLDSTSAGMDEWVSNEVLVGDPADAVRQISRCMALGFNHFILRTAFPAMDPGHCDRTLALLGSEVIPAIVGGLPPEP
jgi:alkanesulfonate monooxygenase SsuD/methylene tetrahydromethanopterin reductase-like flavin-dependent oxidoreductase (luciferase family)